MIKKLNFMAISRRNFRENVQNGIYQFMANIMKIYLIGDQTRCFSHWCSELLAVYSRLGRTRNKTNNKYFTNQDVIDVFDEFFDISINEQGLTVAIDNAVYEVNISEQTSFSLEDVDLVEIRDIVLKLLSKTCSSEWTGVGLESVLNQYR